MKKLGISLLAFMLFSLAFVPSIQAQKNRNAKLTDLTALSQEFIKQYYADQTIDYIMVEGTRKAEVEFKDGTEIKFGRDGYWIEIENDKGIPLDRLQMLPGQMLTSLRDDFGEYTITEVERMDVHYLVKLEGKNKKEIKLRYDLNGQYLF